MSNTAMRKTFIRGHAKNIYPGSAGKQSGTPMKTFILLRHEDETGISGVGAVAEGVQFSDGTCVVRWKELDHDDPNYIRGVRATTVTLPDVEAVEALHGHGGRTIIQWC